MKWYGEYDDANPEQSFRQRTAEAEEKVQDAYERGFKEGQMNILETQE